MNYNEAQTEGDNPTLTDVALLTILVRRKNSWLVNLGRKGDANLFWEL
jgi:hypothetical protein